MKRDIKGRKPKKEKKKSSKKLKRFIITAMIIIIGVVSYRKIDSSIMPCMIAMAELEAHSIASKAINTSVKEIIEEKEIKSTDLLTYHYNDKSEISAIGINTIVINEITSDIIDRISSNIKETGVAILHIPLGELIGNQLLERYGPHIKIRLLPVGTASIDYEREFRATGINQINHRIWLDIEVKLQVVIPFLTKELVVNQKITLVDSVFSGEIPQNYVNVPEESILDVSQ